MNMHVYICTYICVYIIHVYVLYMWCIYPHKSEMQGKEAGDLSSDGTL